MRFARPFERIELTGRTGNVTVLRRPFTARILSFVIHLSLSHYGDPLLRPTHGPTTWPLWRLCAFRYVDLPSVNPPSWGKRLWIYTRNGAVLAELYKDNRRMIHE